MLVFYYDATLGSLRQATATSAWAFQYVDGNGSTATGHTTDNVGQFAATVLDNSQPVVFYYDATKGSLRIATLNGASWSLGTLDGP